MGSSSQHYRDTLSTEGADNTTLLTPDEPHWWREAVRWPALESNLRWAWIVHVYGLAFVFCVLAILGFFTILRLRAQLSARPHLSPLNLFLCILAASRAVVLFADPYGSKQALPAVALRVLWDLGHPCLVSAFALLQLWLVRATRFRLGPSRLRSESLITVVVTAHFCLIITTGMLATLQRSLRIVWLLTQACFIAWGGLLCGATLRGSVRLLRGIAELPLHLPSGRELSSVAPLGVFAGESARPPPRIRVTDVDDRTFSYVSETAAQHAGCGLESQPLHQILSPIHCKDGVEKSQIVSPSEDPALVRPLVAERVNSPSTIKETLPTLQSAPEQLCTLQAMPSDLKSSLSRLSSRPTLEEFRFEARGLKRRRPSRPERQLRRLAAASAFGLMLGVLQACDVFAPANFNPGASVPAVLAWFCLQTIARIVEITMAFIMMNITQQSLRNHYYYPA